MTTAQWERLAKITVQDFEFLTLELLKNGVPRKAAEQVALYMAFRLASLPHHDALEGVTRILGDLPSPETTHVHHEVS